MEYQKDTRVFDSGMLGCYTQSNCEPVANRTERSEAAMRELQSRPPYISGFRSALASASAAALHLISRIKPKK